MRNECFSWLCRWIKGVFFQNLPRSLKNKGLLFRYKLFFIWESHKFDTSVDL